MRLELDPETLINTGIAIFVEADVLLLVEENSVWALGVF